MQTSGKRMRRGTKNDAGAGVGEEMRRLDEGMLSGAKTSVSRLATATHNGRQLPRQNKHVPLNVQVAPAAVKISQSSHDPTISLLPVLTDAS